jgi:hypothetical protein
MKRSLFFLLACLSILLLLAMPPEGAQAAPRPQGGSLAVSADSTAKSGMAGSSVIYTVTITNNAAADDTVTITSVSDFTVGVAPNPVLVPAGGSASVQVAVSIPGSAQPGNSSVASLNFAGSPSGATAGLTLVTSVQAEPVNLPQRPVVVIKAYYAGTNNPKPGTSFNLFIELKNSGGEEARDIKITFQGDGLLPEGTGGVLYAADITSGGTKTISQSMYVNPSLIGTSVVSLPVQMSYTDIAGTPYTEAFNLTLTLGAYATGPTSTPTPTSTAQPVVRPQLVVGSYTTDIDPLQPGTLFNLEMEIRNLGNADANAVTMVLGGGATVDNSGTPVPGGTSGGSADMTNFAPVGSSNLVFLGDIPTASITTTTSKLIVNVTANPGAYQFKLSFVYSNNKGVRMVDDQVITLLIYRLPQLEINFYRDPNPLYSGQPNVLPVQITNLGRNSAVLGNLVVSSETGDVQNNISLVGLLDPGGSYPWDATFIPYQGGDSVVVVTINYTDDFNQQRQIVQEIPITVIESAPSDGGEFPNGEGGFPVVPEPVQETFWQKVLRFFKGLFGLDSSAPVQATPEGVLPSEGEIITIPSGGGGGGKVP